MKITVYSRLQKVYENKQETNNVDTSSVFTLFRDFQTDLSVGDCWGRSIEAAPPEAAKEPLAGL